MDFKQSVNLIQPGVHYLQGSQACAEGALMAGCSVYAGYPITPASEVMEHAALRFPQVGARFIQMEDEIASSSALLGASLAGAKAITATSSPGFSLMQEVISYAIMAEIPLVIVDVQRPGPGQGYITASQEDVMQARWGHHGEGSAIALAPSSVQEMFDLTVEAFNLAERWRTPVLLMTEETVAHMRERFTVPEQGSLRIVERTKPQDMGIAPEEYLPWGHDTVAPMAAWGDGYAFNCVGLVHLEDGNVTRYGTEMHHQCIKRLKNKIEGRVDEIARLETFFLDDCEHVVICYGAVFRSAIEAVNEAREQKGLKIGLVRLVTLWPFPGKQLRRLIGGAGRIFVPEMNLGMMLHPVTEALRDRCERIVPIPELGRLHTPELILSSLYQELP
ncbi:MAG: 2-oxoacid:acceptor oxidoreductase subunit alpha [Desulfohalobiaceae bacterium]|nr:2-oxoacid:acceptor oxidoreductase subunit alpha [Desulfohalobiaceae bacterium]